MKKFPIHPARHGKLTGIETEGDLAGEIVCPVIYLWKVNHSNMRVAGSYKLEHDTPVIVDKRAGNEIGEKLVHVRKADRRSIHGWVTERFVEYD